MALDATQRTKEESRMSVMVLDAIQRSQRIEQDSSSGPGCHPEKPEKRAGCQQWPWTPPRGDREESRMSAMALDATQRSQRREQDVSDGPRCHPEEPEKRAGCQRWPWMPPRGAREESRMSAMALDATQRSQRRGRMAAMALDVTQRRQRREQDVSDGPGCHPKEPEKGAGCQ